MEVAESLIPYLVIVFNAVFFRLLRCLLKPITPHVIGPFIWEFISTLQLCSGCAELGVVWARHGNVGLAITLFFVCYWWCGEFGDAEACPCGPIEDVILLKQPITRANISFRLIGQILGAYFTASFTDMIWRFHLTPEHSHLHNSRCQATLQTSVINAFFVELLITFISRVVSLESYRLSNQSLVKTINSLTTVILSLAAMESSGGFFNPILASALTLNCQGNDLFEHFTVYWVGSIIGGILARYLHIFLIRTIDREFRKKLQ